MENKPFKVLVGSDAAMYVTNTLLFNTSTNLPYLAIGEIAVVNADNNICCSTALSDGSTTATRVYFAVGVDTDGDGVCDDVIKSPIVKVGKNLTNWSKQTYTAYTAQVMKLSWTLTKCATEYGLKITFNGVPISNYLGFHELRKTFATKTGCCTDCDANCNEDTYSCDNLADELVSLINADPDNFVTAAKVTTNDFAAQTIAVAAAGGTVSIDIRNYAGVGTANVIRLPRTYATGEAANLQQDLQVELDSYGSGGEVVVTEVSTNFSVKVTNSNLAKFGIGAHASTPSSADSAATTATSSGVPATGDTCPGITLTVNAKAIADFCRVPVNFVEANGITMSVTGFSGFECNFDADEQTAMVYAQGKGISIKALEEEATGFTEGYPEYRYTSFMQPDPKVNLYTNTSYNYDVFAFELFDEHSSTSSGAEVYKAPIKFYIACKTGGTATTNLTTVAGNID